MSKYAIRDHYVDSQTGVLKNKLGIKDEATLEQQEADYAAVRSYQLSQYPIQGDFDFPHLKAVHRHLFGDLYEWAGEIRDIDIAKGQTRFAHYQHIEAVAARVFNQLADERHLAGLDEKDFSERVAYYLAEINALHPFRDGNGRSQREFVSLLALKNGYQIEWKRISQEMMIQASIASFCGDTKQLAILIRESLIPSM